jgi:flagellar basal body-associated protein FliL
VVVLLAIGGGLGFFIASSLPALAGKHDEAKAADAGKAEAEGGHGHGEGAAKGNALEGLHEVELNDLVSNVRNQGGRRYVKVSCSLWVAEHDVLKLVPPAEEHGEGTPKENESIKRIVRMRLEEHLKGYDLEDLTAPNVYTEIGNGFRDKIERELHAIYTDVGADYRFVKRVVLTNLLVQ